MLGARRRIHAIVVQRWRSEANTVIVTTISPAFSTPSPRLPPGVHGGEGRGAGELQLWSPREKEGENRIYTYTIYTVGGVYRCIYTYMCMYRASNLVAFKLEAAIVLLMHANDRCRCYKSEECKNVDPAAADD